MSSAPRCSQRHGTLLPGGARTVVVDGAAGSVATHSGGQLTQNNAGTLVSIPESGQPSGNEAPTFGRHRPGPQHRWPVGGLQVRGTNTQGDYVTLTARPLPIALSRPDTNGYNSTIFAGSSGTSVVNVTDSPTIGEDVRQRVTLQRFEEHAERALSLPAAA